MATTVADRVVVDTNVLVAATDTSRSWHREAVDLLVRWPAAGTALYTSGQILREYLVVATRPPERNGLGLARPDALANVGTLRARLGLLAEDARVADRLLHLVESAACSGKQVHDANVVATMLVHGVDTVVTLNTSDFARFTDVVSVWDLRP